MHYKTFTRIEFTLQKNGNYTAKNLHFLIKRDINPHTHAPTSQSLLQSCLDYNYQTNFSNGPKQAKRQRWHP